MPANADRRSSPVADHAPSSDREGGAGRHTRDLTVQYRIFAVLAIVIAVFAAIYWFSSYDWAGTVMLALAAALSTLTATYLWWQDRFGHEPSARGREAGPPEEPYLPDTSIWPFGIGLGAFLAFNGLVLGFGYAVPGALVLALSVIGFVRQSRLRA